MKKINRKKHRSERRKRATSRATTIPENTPGPNRKDRRAEPKMIKRYLRTKKLLDMKTANEKEAKRQKEEAKKLKIKKN